ncbi:hypothetical protein [Hymenobacter sp. BRD67]|uniref:hypothetical protein n=1 Tax=Hymenobacter sp. BRD67 TaxID=2675877 RepID=UPI001563AB24|nr:hypothetical protein [Hymenobacter sp. BRD67]QKG53887.1 hypothetical protein GKZ67_16360 [Hymenobacter sp. BRD67]
MLVLFVLSYKLFQDESERLKEANKQLNARLEQLDVIQRIENSLRTMMSDKTLFQYEPKFRRYTLARDVAFVGGKWDLSSPEKALQHPEDAKYLAATGEKLRIIVDSLLILKKSTPKLRDVSYVLAIVGSASNLYKDPYHPKYDTYAYTSYENWNYILSYQRAKSLYDFWKNNNIVDFDSKKYHDVVELILAGNGFGGVGRYNENGAEYNTEEWKNQRFLIQIIPKVGRVVLK